MQREAAQTRRRFLCRLDHELKNPLTALRAEIAYLEDGPRVENYTQAMSDMSAQVENLGRLVTELRKLAELVDNALKFSPPGATIQVRAFETAPWLVVEVVNSGPGISEDDLPHVFEELYRGSNAGDCPGSGLGLALVRAIVARHEGSISVRSRPEQGAVFTMCLPIAS